MKKDCVVCGNKTPAVDEAWGVAICGSCAINVMTPLVGRALVLDNDAADFDRCRVQVLGRLRDAVRGVGLRLRPECDCEAQTGPDKRPCRSGSAVFKLFMTCAPRAKMEPAWRQTHALWQNATSIWRFCSNLR